VKGSSNAIMWCIILVFIWRAWGHKRTNFSDCDRCVCHDSNWASPKYKLGALQPEATYWVSLLKLVCQKLYLT